MTGPIFDDAAIKSISSVFGEMFTGSTIDELLRAARIPIPDVSTKWRRIHAALLQEQERSGSRNCTLILVTQAIKPQRWVGNQSGFESLRADLNGVLAFNGIEIGRDGQLRNRKVATTLDEAVATSRRLRDEMVRRGGHAEVFKYCSRELVADDCFNAVFEAIKGLAQRIRAMADVDLDGRALIEHAFSASRPVIAFNSLRTVTERNEQSGLLNIMTGIFGAFRNPSAHQPKLSWHVAENDALDLLSTLSLIHRRLDTAVVLTPSASD
jgi:uncharacterized protein (TIGR02391 family)